jgi:hypothetical protein
MIPRKKSNRVGSSRCATEGSVYKQLSKFEVVYESCWLFIRLG